MRKYVGISEGRDGRELEKGGEIEVKEMKGRGEKQRMKKHGKGKGK